MTGGYRVDPAELAQARAFAAQACAGARSALRELREDADELLGSRWRGVAATRYAHGWAEWFAGASVMLDVLEESAALLGASGSGYAATDDSIRAGVAGASA